MKFDEFVKGCVLDTVENGSGAWPKPVRGEVAAYAEGIRSDAREVNEGRGQWLGLQHLCRTCGRLSLTLEDGECLGCLEGAEETAERVKRDNAAAARVGHAQTADLLRRIAADERLDATFRAVILEQAAWHEEKAS